MPADTGSAVHRLGCQLEQKGRRRPSRPRGESKVRSRGIRGRPGSPARPLLSPLLFPLSSEMPSGPSSAQCPGEWIGGARGTGVMLRPGSAAADAQKK